MPENTTRRGVAPVASIRARRPRAERIAAEIVFAQPKMRDQRVTVLRQRIGRIGGGDRAASRSIRARADRA